MNVQNNSGAILYRFPPIFQAPTRKRKTPVSELTGVFMNENARSLFFGSRSSSVFNGVSSFVDSALGSISSFVDGIIDGFIAFVARHGEYSEADSSKCAEQILEKFSEFHNWIAVCVCSESLHNHDSLKDQASYFVILTLPISDIRRPEAMLESQPPRHGQRSRFTATVYGT
jgi:hypothetical protein